MHALVLAAPLMFAAPATAQAPAGETTGDGVPPISASTGGTAPAAPEATEELDDVEREDQESSDVEVQREDGSGKEVDAQPPVAPLPAATDQEPQDAAEAVEAGSWFIDALQERNWTLAFALGTMLVVFLIRRFGLLDKLPRDAAAWVSVALGVCASAASALLTEDIALGEAVLNGVVAGLSGAGMWSAAGKHVLTRKPRAEPTT